MKIKLANKKDVLELSKLRWDFQVEDEEIKNKTISEQKKFVRGCSKFLRKKFDTKSWFFWVVEDKSKIIAHAFVNKIDMIPKPKMMKDQYGYLTNMYTIPGYRNKKIGSKLITKIKRWAKKENLELLIVWPSEKSKKFYKRAGFNTKNEVMELKLRN